MAGKKNEGVDENAADITRLVRSIQHLQGEPECFGSAAAKKCDKECQWREYCLNSKPTGTKATHHSRRKAMPETKSTQKNKKQRVTFSIKAPEAREVNLMGDFNNWTPNKHPMEKDSAGIWKKTLMLAPSTYEYKFLVDGEWREDSQNDRTCPNCFGTANNVLQL